MTIGPIFQKMAEDGELLSQALRELELRERSKREQLLQRAAETGKHPDELAFEDAMRVQRAEDPARHEETRHLFVKTGANKSPS